MKIYLWLRKSSFNGEISLFYLLNQWDFPHGRLCGFELLKHTSILQGRSRVLCRVLCSRILRGIYIYKTEKHMFSEFLFLKIHMALQTGICWNRTPIWKAEWRLWLRSDGVISQRLIESWEEWQIVYGKKYNLTLIVAFLQLKIKKIENYWKQWMSETLEMQMVLDGSQPKARWADDKSVGSEVILSLALSSLFSEFTFVSLPLPLSQDTFKEFLRQSQKPCVCSSVAHRVRTVSSLEIQILCWLPTLEWGGEHQPPSALCPAHGVSPEKVYQARRRVHIQMLTAAISSGLCARLCGPWWAATFLLEKKK